MTRTSTGTECACTAGFDLGLVDLLDLGPCQCTSTVLVRLYGIGLLSDDDVPSRAVLVPDVVHSHGTALAIM